MPEPVQIEIDAKARQFDGRTVYIWRLIDESNRVRQVGCEISRQEAMRQAKRAVDSLGPTLLLDMLEGRGAV